MSGPANALQDNITVEDDDEGTSRTRFAQEVGQVLRRVRASRGLSLRQVTIRSHGRFKPSSVASYERGERQISLERLFALADVYEFDVARIVVAVAARLGRGGVPTAAGSQPTGTIELPDAWPPGEGGDPTDQGPRA